MLKKAAALLFVGASLMMLGSCVSNSSSSRYVYAAIPSASQIIAYREDPNSGILTALTTSPVAAGPTVQSLAMSPSGKYLYAANSGEGDVSQFTISSSGTLTESGSRVKVGAPTPTILAIDAAGTFLYVGNAGSNSVSVFSIDSGSGSLSPVPNSPFPVGLSPLNLKVTSAGFLYITGLGPTLSGGTIEVWSVSSISTGALTFVNTFQSGTNPNGLAISPDGSHLYTANTADNSISEFSIGSDGNLTALNGSPIGESYNAPLSVAVESSGKFLYVTNEGSANIAAYAIGSDGSLTVLGNSPFASASQPSFIGVDPKGNYIFVGNQSSPVIQPFSLDPSAGTLTSVATYSVGNSATSIVITP